MFFIVQILVHRIFEGIIVFVKRVSKQEKHVGIGAQNSFIHMNFSTTLSIVGNIVFEL